MVTQPLFPFARDLFVVDLFAGGGGASEGIRRALGRCPDVAVNHDAHAIEMHARNHPSTRHYQEDVFAVDPVHACGGKQPDFLWASPDCKHFSKAKGGKPKSKKVRGLAWVVRDWARDVRPRVIGLENVEEFTTWGPLNDEGQPIKDEAGETFREFVASLEALGYAVDWRILCCADYGSPTTRKRLFLIARLDGAPVWPEATHGTGPGLAPYRTAAECIDWSIPVPSIFERRKPLADKTRARIAAGIKRYVIDDPDPYLVTLPSGERVAASMVQTGYGERKGQAPRTLDIRKPLGTVVAAGQKHALVLAWLAKHYTGVVGQHLDDPIGTVTAVDHHSLCAAHVTKFYGTSTGTSMKEPVHTITADAGGGHMGLVAAFMTKYYGQGVGSSMAHPLHTVTTKDRFGVVLVHLDGEPYAITDIGLRMLQPRELARAHGFSESYVLEGTKRAQVARIGNSVPCAPVEAIVRANLPHLARRAS